MIFKYLNPAGQFASYIALSGIHYQAHSALLTALINTHFCKRVEKGHIVDATSAVHLVMRYGFIELQ